VIRLRDEKYKSYLSYFIPPFEFAAQYLGCFSHNALKFVRRDFHLAFDAGLKRLIEVFYAAVSTDAPLPLSYREILLTSRIMDDIFSQIRNASGAKEKCLQDLDIMTPQNISVG
jgi:hypothetical protein